jgi:hypothetical protein
MNLNNIEINVLVKGRKAKEFQSPMDFQTYIEGRDGSEFEIELVNNHSTDVEAILSVDGLSVTDGKPAGSKSPGYMVKARSQITIPGWTLDTGTVAKFFFAGSKGGSYAEQSGQDSRNKGVIGAKVFARKNDRNSVLFDLGFRTKDIMAARGIGGNTGTAARGMGGNTGTAAGGIGGNLAHSFMGASVNTSCSTSNSMLQGLDSDPALEQTLGTGFGDAADFATHQVDFYRGDLLALIELFYDDAKGLKRRGIDVHRSDSRPTAFPADEPKGCTPPAGWSKNR